MGVLNRQQIYVPDTTVEKARALGMTNFSLFVRESLEEYIEARDKPAKTAPDCHP